MLELTDVNHVYANETRASALVPVAGIEPATFGLQNRCSTS
jgi:hypothetical protein